MAMQPAELRAIRKAKGWTLKQMADELGLSDRFLGTLERGADPIEGRTERAARSLVPAAGMLIGGSSDGMWCSFQDNLTSVVLPLRGTLAPYVKPGEKVPPAPTERYLRHDVDIDGETRIALVIEGEDWTEDRIKQELRERLQPRQ